MYRSLPVPSFTTLLAMMFGMALFSSGAPILTSQHVLATERTTYTKQQPNFRGVHENATSIVQELLLPRAPFTVVYGEPSAFVYRTLVPEGVTEHVRIYLARYPPNNVRTGPNDEDPETQPDVLSELGRRSVPAGSMVYMMIWTPTEEVGAPVEGGDGYVLLFMRTHYWGCKKEEVFETVPFSILPERDNTATAKSNNKPSMQLQL